MGSVLLALLRYRVVEHAPESYFMGPVTSLKSPPRGSVFWLGSIIRWLLYEPVKAKTSPPRGEVAASALSYGLRLWWRFGHRVARLSPRALYYGSRGASGQELSY